MIIQNRLTRWTKVNNFINYTIHRNALNKAWLFSWRGFPPNFATWRREIFPPIPLRPQFRQLDLSRFTIVNFSRLCIDHNLLPYFSFRLSLNLLPFCTFHTSVAYCDICHILLTVRLSRMIYPFFPYSTFTATPLSTLNFSLTLVFPPLFF